MNATTNKTKCFQVGLVSNRRLTVNRKSEPFSYEVTLEKVGELDGFYQVKLNGLQVGESFYLPYVGLYFSIRRVA